MNFNKVIIGGNITRDPELKYTPKGTAVCKIGMAINRTWKNDAGEKMEEVCFVDVDAFGRTAENIGQYMKKGSQMLVEGRLKLDQWDDKQTGQKRQRLGVVAESVQFIGGKSSAETAPARQTPSSARQSASQQEPTSGDDSVPF